MTIFFNLKTLLKISKGNPDKIMVLFNKYVKEVKGHCSLTIDLRGSDFLLKPDILIKTPEYSNSDKAQYIVIAGKRNYLEYKKYGFKGLDLSYHIDIDTDKIKYNPLLTIKQNKIYLKFEE